MEIFDRRLLRLLEFLTIYQGWLSASEIAEHFRLDGKGVHVRTIHRWFSHLQGLGPFRYYPYPRADVLGMQEVLVTLRGLRTEEIVDVVPYGAAFQIDVGLADCVPMVRQGYWIPGSAMGEFRDYWKTARDLGLVEDVEILECKNTHFVFSPLADVISPEGVFQIGQPVDNGYFETLIRRNLRDGYKVKVGDAIAASPLVVPNVMEHIWEHFSSRQVWRAIRGKGADHLHGYSRGRTARSLQKTGSAIRLLQRQWRELLDDFRQVFLQPRVSFSWSSIPNWSGVSLVIETGSTDSSVDAAIRLSKRAAVTILKPGIRSGGECHISCLIPDEELLHVLEVVGELHRGRGPPLISLMHAPATFRLYRRSRCKVDWRLFDPAEICWKFEGEQYVERLKGIRPGPESGHEQESGILSTLATSSV